jgi:3-oxoadipate enol-lactonase
MGYVEHDGANLYYQLEGRDDAPCVVLSNSLGTDLALWEPQMQSLLRHFRVLRYDARGHGRSSVTPGPYSIEQLGRDVVALMDHAGLAKAHFCGLSMGGMIGMWLATEQPQRIDRLVLSNTAARIAPPEQWNARIATVEAQGMAAIVPAVLNRWFTAGFQQRAPQTVDQVRAMLLRTPVAGYTAACAAVRDMDQRDRLAAIVAPTLVIAGSEDLSTPPAEGRLMAQQIPGACYVELNAAHLSNLEQAGEFTDSVLGFLTQQAA